MKEQIHSSGPQTPKPAESNQADPPLSGGAAESSVASGSPEAPVALPGTPAVLGSAEAVASGSPEDPESGLKPFDYGGLPARNLKKNLGCG